MSKFVFLYTHKSEEDTRERFCELEDDYIFIRKIRKSHRAWAASLVHM